MSRWVHPAAHSRPRASSKTHHDASRSVFVHPLEPTQAFDLTEGWLEQPCATVVHPTDRHPAVLRELLEPFGTAGNLTSDAHLAALAIEHGAELCSSDSDFSRFSELRWSDPLA